MANAYLDFARNNPALYDAMFTRATQLRFGDADTPASLSAAFAQLREGLSDVTPDGDAETLTEVFWAALHGLATLARGGRLRRDHDSDRAQLMVTQIIGSG
jgi:hypothetical protein